MRSPSLRILVEWALHAVATAAIVVLLWLSLHPPVASTNATVSSSTLAAALPRWTVNGAPDSVSLVVDRVPDPITRDWLVALRRAGSVLSWSSKSLTPSAMTAERVVDPQGGVLVRVAAPTGSAVSVADDAGTIDSLRASAGVGLFRLTALAGLPRTHAGSQNMQSAVADSLTLRRLLVLGRVGWETKFTIAALEERGWLVDTRLSLSPGQSITQGAAGTIDTSRYAAVIIFDSAAVTNVGAVVKYVNDGGGLIVGGAAARMEQLASTLPGRAGQRTAPRQRLRDTADVEGARYPIVAMRRDALVLERTDSVITVAARRAGAGRVIQLSDEETWRRRMQRSEGSVAAHRDWWTRIVGAVAYVPRVYTTTEQADAAPVASLIAALGEPASTSLATLPKRDTKPEPWLFGIAAVALIAEWASRRWRGAA